MTVRNIASICNMVSGHRRLGGRARGAARQRKRNPSRTLARRRGGGRRGRPAPLEVPGPGPGAPQPLEPPGCEPRAPRPLSALGPGSPLAGPRAAPRASALGLRCRRLGWGGRTRTSWGRGLGDKLGVGAPLPVLAVDEALTVSQTALVSF